MARVTWTIVKRLQRWREKRQSARFWHDGLDATIDALIEIERGLVIPSPEQNGGGNPPPKQPMPVNEKMRSILAASEEQNHHIEEDALQSSFDSPFQSRDASDVSEESANKPMQAGTSNGAPTPTIRETLGGVFAELDAMEVFAFDGPMEDAFQVKKSARNRSSDGRVTSKLPDENQTDGWFAKELSSQYLEAQRPEDMDELQGWLLRRETHWWNEQTRVQATVQLGARRKVIDGRKSVRRMARGAGIFDRFAYRESPTSVDEFVCPLHLVVIGDVSGSMGKYVATVLYVLSSLQRMAKVESYIFSDDVTYTTALLGRGTFRAQYARLKSSALSWEYGTRLDVALATILREEKFRKDTTVVLFTDGGFTLSNDAFQTTQRAIRALKTQVARILIATPNDDLATDGPTCAEEFWRVQHLSEDGLLTPWLQKIARFGLLAYYSDEIIRCQTTNDFKILVERVVATSLEKPQVSDPLGL